MNGGIRYGKKDMEKASEFSFSLNCGRNTAYTGNLKKLENFCRVQVELLEKEIDLYPALTPLKEIYASVLEAVISGHDLENNNVKIIPSRDKLEVIFM